MRIHERLAMAWSVGLVLGVLAYLVLPWRVIVDGSAGPHAADWVQAWGTIAAVLAGAGALAWQVRAQARAGRRLSLQQHVDTLSSIHALLRYAHDRVGHVHRLMADADRFERYLRLGVKLDELHQVKAALDATDVASVPDPAMKLSFLSGREAFADALDLLTRIREDHPSAEALRASGRLARWRAEIAGHDARLGVRAGEVLRRIEELRRSAEPEPAGRRVAGG
jgi:hypothetical protein